MVSTEMKVTRYWGLRQPRRGLFILAVSLLVALGMASLWPPDVLQGVPFGFILCIVPVLVFMGLFWKGWPAEKLDQPVRGIALLMLALFFAIIVFMWTKLFIGNGELSPLTNIFGITVVTLMVIGGPLLEFWPFAGRISKPFAGIWWLILVYVIGFILFRTLYNFAPMSAEPWYNPAIDPGGRFPAVVPLTVVVMGLPFAFAIMHLGMWPFSRLKKPWCGIAACAAVWILAWVLYEITTSILGFGVTEAQVKFGVYGVFGMMIWQMMFETWPSQGLPQPVSGLIRIVIGIILSFIMFYLVRGFGLWAFPDSAALQGDGLYQWMATVALGLCFPFFAMYTTMFQSWPLPVPEKPE